MLQVSGAWAKSVFIDAMFPLNGWRSRGRPADTYPRGTLFNSHPFAWGWHHQLSFEFTQKPFSRSWEGFSEASAEWSCCLRTTFVWDSRASLHERTCLVTVSFQFLTRICILKLVNLHLSTLPPPLAPTLSFQAENCPQSSCPAGLSSEPIGTSDSLTIFSARDVD